MEAVDVDDTEGVRGNAHSSSLASGEVALEDDTSPLRVGLFLRDLASDREEDDGIIV
jgi:hypothetical protein